MQSADREINAMKGVADLNSNSTSPDLDSDLSKIPVEKKSLGTVAVVLLPLEKLKIKSTRGRPFEQEIHEFLLRNFSGYTVSSGNISGHWEDDQGRDHYGEHREYKVALSGSGETSSILEIFLAKLAEEMDEESIYIELGSKIFLISSGHHGLD